MYNYTYYMNIDRDYNWDAGIVETCIITVPNHAGSIAQSEIALRSCQRVGQINPMIFWSYDATSGENIITPDHLMGQDHSGWIKVLDPALSIREVACALSHIAVWAHCITLNRPIVVLEHDAVMIRPFNFKTQVNCLEYLGHKYDVPSEITRVGVGSHEELVEYYMKPENAAAAVEMLPMTALINYNYLYPMGLHAYAIDPFIARRLYSRVLLDGLINPIDVVVEVTEFEVSQSGVYAFCHDENTQGHIISTINNDEQTLMRGRKSIFSIPGISQ